MFSSRLRADHHPDKKWIFILSVSSVATDEGVVKLPFKQLSACPAYSGLADFGLEKTLAFYFVDEKHLVGI